MTTEAMQGGRMRVFEVSEDELTSAEEFHAQIAASFGFPSYYGANLAALQDCLEDVSTPWQVIVKRAPLASRRPWLDGFCTVFSRVARENPAIECQVREDASGQDTLEQILARIERIDLRLEAMQEMPPAPAVAAATGAAGGRTASETCRNLASGSDGDRFKCGECGCRISDYL